MVIRNQRTFIHIILKLNTAQKVVTNFICNPAFQIDAQTTYLCTTLKRTAQSPNREVHRTQRFF